MKNSVQVLRGALVEVSQNIEQGKKLENQSCQLPGPACLYTDTRVGEQ